jgi:hypothetical protein
VPGSGAKLHRSAAAGATGLVELAAGDLGMVELERQLGNDETGV